MANVQETVDDAISITGRVEQRDLAVSELSRVIYEVTSKFDFPQDLEEDYQMISQSGELVTGGFEAYIPEGWRKLALVTNGYTGRVLREVTPFTAASHQTQCSLQDTYMRYGDSVRGVISEPTDTIVLHGYRAAPRWEANYDRAGWDDLRHWLLTEQYQLCLTGLIGKLFRNSGDDESGDRYQGEYLQLRRQLILNAQNMDGRS